MRIGSGIARLASDPIPREASRTVSCVDPAPDSFPPPPPRAPPSAPPLHPYGPTSSPLLRRPSPRAVSNLASALAFAAFGHLQLPPLAHCRRLYSFPANALHQKAIPFRYALLFEDVSCSRLFGRGGAALSLAWLPRTATAQGGGGGSLCGSAQRSAERPNFFFFFFLRETEGPNSNTNCTAPSSVSPNSPPPHGRTE